MPSDLNTIYPKLISRKNLADRWEISVQTVIVYEAEGIITRIPSLPTPRYKISEIEKIEGIEENPLSPIERRRLEKENKDLRDQLSFVNKLISNISLQCTSYSR